VLERIDGLTARGKPWLALALLEDFFDEMEDALGNIDDSNGQKGMLAARAAEIHLQACRTAKPDPVELARELYTREVDSEWDFFHRASEIYVDVLGKEGLAEYGRLAEEAWKKIKPLHAGNRSDDDRYGLRFRLASILESFAARDGDIDRRIAIRRKDLSTAYDYLEIARLCLEHGRDEEALKWAEEGLWQFEDDPDGRLILLAANLYVRLGRKADAERILWQEFERRPSLGFYKPMKVALEKQRSIADRAIAILRADLDKSPAKPAHSVSLADVMIEILVYEKRFDEAWQAVGRYEVGKHLRVRLAEITETSHPTEAWRTFANHVEGLVPLGGRTNYLEACKFIVRAGRIRAGLGDEAGHVAWFDELKACHKAKRAFLQLLQR
jgi:tetratricopeptide (TPR) repeat protein